MRPPCRPLAGSAAAVVPCPGVLDRTTWPRWFSIIDLVIARPRPAPGMFDECALAARKKRVKAWSSSSSVMPTPVSVTSQRSSCPVAPTLTVTVPPWFVFLMALEMRLSMA